MCFEEVFMIALWCTHIKTLVRPPSSPKVKLDWMETVTY